MRGLNKKKYTSILGLNSEVAQEYNGVALITVLEVTLWKRTEMTEATQGDKKLR